MIELIKKECIQAMREIEDNSIDAVITDPPYGTTACKWDSVIPFKPMWEQLNRITKPNGAIVLFGSEPFSSALRMSNIKNYKYDWVWKKNKPTGMLNAKRQPMRNIENVIVFYKKQCTYNFIKEDREHKKPTKTAKCYSKNNQQNGTHNDTERVELPLKRYPTTIKQKPVALMEYLIKTYTDENETVLDFTMGSGTTGIACINTNRKFIGIELDNKYFELAKKRIDTHTSQKRLF